LLCATATAKRDTDSEAATHSRDEADAASYLAKTNGDAAVSREGEIHPFRAIKHAVALAEQTEDTLTENKQEIDAGAGGGAAVAGNQQNTPDLMRYFEKAQSQSKNAARRQTEMKMRVGAQKRAARQQQQTTQADKGEVITPIPVQAAVEESAKKVEHPHHPHLLAFYLEQLAEQAEDRADASDAGIEVIEPSLVQLEQVSTGAAAAAAATTAPAAAAATTTAPAAAATTTATTTAPAATTTAAAATTTAAAAATTTAAAATTTAAAAATTTAPASADTAAAAAGAASTGGAAAAAGAASTGADAVINSVVPLAHLQQLQNELSGVEAEHAARQAELNAELQKQQAQTQQLLKESQEGTVGLTETPTLIDPVKHVPIDPNNEVLYDAAPTDPKMNIKPSVFTKANDLIASADSQHTEFEHNMPIECAEPTCTADQ